MANVLIIGGSRGIGAACVRRFAARGDRVAFTYNTSADAAHALAAELGCRAGDEIHDSASALVSDHRCRALKCDVRDAESVDAAVAEAICALGTIDALVTCAGVAHFALAQDTTERDLMRVVDTDLCGTFRACRAVIPHMVREKRGRIVTVASMWGEVGASCESAYSAAKGGVIALTKALAKELAPSGITVNCVSPGVIDTDMNAALSPDALTSLAAETPLGRIGSPDEVAAAVAFFASDDASFITGQVLGANGGYII